MDAMATAPSDDTALIAERLRFAVTRLARRMRQHTGTGLSPTQAAALATVERKGPMPVGEVAEVEHISAPTATKTVDKLHDAGLVERRTDPNDRRVSLVSITAAGRELLTDVRQRKAAWLAEQLEGLEDDEVGRLTAALDVIEHLTRPPRPGIEPAEADAERDDRT